jgi:ribonuclease HII
MGWTIVGVDEVGRGCLAGPVVCAAVIIPNEDRPWVDLVKDSKKVSPKRRQLLSEYITEECIYSIREGSSKLVDSQNILQATLQTMKVCVESVVSQVGNVDFVLVDGNQKIPGLSVPQKTVIHGDSLHKSIGAASIIAKVHRDSYMVGMDGLYPEYGFAQHKGYGTAQHREAIMMHGPCKIHRLTFKGVHEYAVKSSKVIGDSTFKP